MLANSALDRALASPGSLARQDAMDLFSWCPTDTLVAAAGRIRDSTRPHIVTYSRKVFINLVNLCRDTCSYCTYKKEPGDPMLSMLSPEQVLAIAQAGKGNRCTEALFVTGERPEQKYPEARDWLASMGYHSTVDYICDIGDQVLQKTGLLPHTNAGSLTKSEMARLKDTNVSMGVMLESSSPRLLGKGLAHDGAPSKNPKVRIKTLESAGELKIPMTTGVLAGIGETPEEMVDSLFVIKELHERHGNIQEVILQNFEPKLETGMAGFPSTPKEYFIRAVALARLIMPALNIQVPPNLNPSIYGWYLDAGINDWGGISPVTIDHVNPEFPWPSIAEVQGVTEGRNKKLRARLPVYPEYLEGGFISEHLLDYVNLLSDSLGLVKEDYVNGI
jgi:FO synthase subunit 1